LGNSGRVLPLSVLPDPDIDKPALGVNVSSIRPNGIKYLEAVGKVKIYTRFSSICSSIAELSTGFLLVGKQTKKLPTKRDSVFQ
jgi:hypothetical protein